MILARLFFGLVLSAAALSQAEARPLVASGRQCIPLRSIKTETAETDTRLIFHAHDGRAFINHLPAPCDGLLDVNNLGKLRLIAKGDKLCAGDAVSVEQSGFRSAIDGSEPDPAATCKLGAFEPVSEMSISELLRR